MYEMRWMLNIMRAAFEHLHYVGMHRHIKPTKTEQMKATKIYKIVLEIALHSERKNRPKKHITKENAEKKNIIAEKQQKEEKKIFRIIPTFVRHIM